MTNVLEKRSGGDDGQDDDDLRKVVDADGSQKWYKDGKEHRDGDKPAVVRPNGTQEWYKNGTRHRHRDKPAIVWDDGSQLWYKNGKLHRKGGPALVVRRDADGVAWGFFAYKVEFMKKENFIRTVDDPLFDPVTMSDEESVVEGSGPNAGSKELKWWYQFWWEDKLITDPMEVLDTVMAERCKGMTTGV